jgi:hypothetical protein
MLTASKFAAVAAILLGMALPASATTRAPVAHNHRATSSDVIPGYGKDGGRTAIPNPDR